MIENTLAGIAKLDWNGMLVPGLSILEKIVRPIIVYFFLIIALRISGKRELAQINTLDFIVLLMIANVIQNAIIGNDNSISGGIIGAISLLIVNYGMEKLIYKNKKAEKLLEGESELLIKKGKINRKILEKELITEKDLEYAAHKQGIFNFNDVESAELDPDGEITFITKNTNPELHLYRELLKRLNRIEKKIDEIENKK